MSALHELGLRAQAAALATGECSARELVEHHLRRIESAADLNAFITVTADAALAAAEAADRRRAAGQARPLDGLPIAHKDLFCTAGVRTSCGSRMLDNFVPPYDATAVARLAAAGAVSLGKTNMDEFAMGSSTEHSWYGPARNPWDRERVPGGSSGGSAAAVAARLVPAASASDTGGSIRQPASFCGITGIKPTYGRVSRHGMVAFASSLDQGGVMAADAADCALLLQYMAGHDPADSTSSQRPLEDFSEQLEQPIAGLKIGLPAAFFGAGLDPAVEAAVRAAAELLRAQGAELVEVSLPNSHLSLPAYYIIAPAEASSNLSRYDGVRYGHRCQDPIDLEDLYRRSRAEGFGAEVKRRILVGTYALSAGYFDAYYKRAQRLRRLISEDFARAFEHCDLLLGPVAPSTAWRLGEKGEDPVAMYLEDIYTLSANLAGLPGLALPVGTAGSLPVGMQLLGPHFSERRLLQVGHQYQLASDWHCRRPMESGA